MDCKLVLLLASVAALHARRASAEDAPARTLALEPFLYPGGTPSADTLQENELLFALNGWASYGVTDRLTLTLDWLVTVAAAPAGYARYRLPLPQSPLRLSVEAYAITFAAHGRVTTFDDPDVPFTITHDNWQGWLHLNASLTLAPWLVLHGHAGATYDRYQRYDPREGAGFDHPLEYRNYLYADYGGGLEVTPLYWLRISANVVRGNNFYVFDQNPHKWLVQYTLQFAPFIRCDGVFWNGIRVELFGMYVRFPWLHYEAAIPPFYPLVMWQGPLGSRPAQSRE